MDTIFGFVNCSAAKINQYNQKLCPKQLRSLNRIKLLIFNQIFNVRVDQKVKNYFQFVQRQKLNNQTKNQLSVERNLLEISPKTPS
jgi:hypothetical protein